MSKFQMIEQDIVAKGKYLEDLIEAWFRKHFHNSKISRDVESINIAQAAKEDLKKQLVNINEAPSLRSTPTPQVSQPSE